MHFVFDKLPLIKIQGPSEVQEWKNDKIVAECYKKLFKRVEKDESNTYMTRIIEKIWKDRRNAPKIQIAFAISICESYLDPENQTISINEHIIKQKITQNLVNSY